ncbi:MAG: patatin-like phospholipase family protein, partial [Luminiphilus sp.]
GVTDDQGQPTLLTSGPTVPAVAASCAVPWLFRPVDIDGRSWADGGKAGATWLQDIGPLGTNAEKPFLETAPWLIAIFAERFGSDGQGNRRKNYYISESVGIATGFLITALHKAGLATLTHTPSPMKFLNPILERPDNERPFILMVVGYAAADARVPRAATQKKALEEIASFH